MLDHGDGVAVGLARSRGSDGEDEVLDADEEDPNDGVADAVPRAAVSVEAGGGALGSDADVDTDTDADETVDELLDADDAPGAPPRGITRNSVRQRDNHRGSFQCLAIIRTSRLHGPSSGRVVTDNGDKRLGPLLGPFPTPRRHGPRKPHSRSINLGVCASWKSDVFKQQQQYMILHFSKTNPKATQLALITIETLSHS